MIRNRVIPVAVAVVLTLAACASVAPGPASAPVKTMAATDRAPGRKGVETRDLNRRVDPCADFDEFANGTFRADNPIPPAKPRWSRRVAGREAIKGRLREILEEVSAKRDWPTGSVERLIGDHYSSCMDEASIDAAGLTPLAPLLRDIAGVRSAADVQRAIRRLHELSVAVPFGTIGAMDYHEPSTFLANVVAGSLGLSDRDRYLKGDPPSADAREGYRAHVARLLELQGSRSLIASHAEATEKRVVRA